MFYLCGDGTVDVPVSWDGDEGAWAAGRHQVFAALLGHDLRQPQGVLSGTETQPVYSQQYTADYEPQAFAALLRQYDGQDVPGWGPDEPLAPVNGTASGTFDTTGAATGAVSVQALASGLLDFTGLSDGRVDVFGAAAGLFDITGAAGGEPPVILIVRDGADGGELGNRRWFKEKYLTDFAEAVEEIEEGKPETVAEALEAFTPLDAPTESAKAIHAALVQMLERRSGYAAMLRRIEAELAALTAYHRKRREEAVLLLLLA